jgi:hypothetical protein
LSSKTGCDLLEEHLLEHPTSSAHPGRPLRLQSVQLQLRRDQVGGIFSVGCSTGTAAAVSKNVMQEQRGISNRTGRRLQPEFSSAPNQTTSQESAKTAVVASHAALAPFAVEGTTKQCLTSIAFFCDAVRAAIF